MPLISISQRNSKLAYSKLREVDNEIYAVKYEGLS